MGGLRRFFMDGSLIDGVNVGIWAVFIDGVNFGIWVAYAVISWMGASLTVSTFGIWAAYAAILWAADASG